VAVGPVSRPIRTTLGAFDLTNAAIASGSESTTPSRTTDPSWFTTQIDVCFNDTSAELKQSNRTCALLNRCCAFVRDLESMFRAGMLKILLQQYLPHAEVGAVLQLRFSAER
jgi:hypothetical protein